MAALEEDMARASARHAFARRTGDWETAEFWRAEVEALSDRIALRDHAADWDVMKGSPEHG